MMISLDGFFEGPNHDLSWHVVDAEFSAFANRQLDDADVLLFGRRTYELMAGFWQTERARTKSPEVARRMNGTKKIVFSRTLQKADWENTRLVKEKIGAEVMGLKNQPGKDLLVMGSSNLCASLIEEGVLDECRVMVNPVMIGSGTSLFSGLKAKCGLELADMRRFQSGNVLLTYRVRR